MAANAPNNQSYTILRIKRKRTDEPLDALVVESRVRRKKSRGAVDVFQFAQTVENDAWEDQRLRQSLQSQISKLSQDSNENGTEQAPPAREAKPTATSSRVPRTNDGTRRYTIKPADEDQKADFRRRPTSPPKVIASKDLRPSDFKMYDAVLAEQAPSIPALDTEMDKFLPMLQDYLSLHDTSSTTPGTTPSAPVGDDYVWDVFYRRPYSLTEWNSVAANVGTLTGLPPSDMDDWSSDSEEEEDEADEDSNAEEYYKNDYPDEEDSDSDGSDIFHDEDHNSWSDRLSNDSDSDSYDWR
ncbi:hypothetical protein F5I97DRAFT_1928562 [Phlebopus sp. FC_14]|nr:hypothetical protein F5I97DRAFT_1928562 [Phlebopus sp. FC_14]